jgi:hypothetical protein
MLKSKSYVDKIYFNSKSDPNTAFIIFGGRKAKRMFSVYAPNDVVGFVMVFFFGITRHVSDDEVTQKIDLGRVS